MFQGSLLKKLSKENLKNNMSDNIENQGCLYIISTPIGNYDDISLRAIKLLQTVDILLREDTRRTKKLLSYLEIKRKNLVSYNDNNGSRKRPYIIEKLLAKNIKRRIRYNFWKLSFSIYNIFFNNFLLGDDKYIFK